MNTSLCRICSCTDLRCTDELMLIKWPSVSTSICLENKDKEILFQLCRSIAAIGLTDMFGRFVHGHGLIAGPPAPWLVHAIACSCVPPVHARETCAVQSSIACSSSRSTRAVMAPCNGPWTRSSGPPSSQQCHAIVHGPASTVHSYRSTSLNPGSATHRLGIPSSGRHPEASIPITNDAIAPNGIA